MNKGSVIYWEDKEREKGDEEEKILPFSTTAISLEGIILNKVNAE